MSDPHPLVCRFGAFGDMVMLTPMLRHLYQRSGLPCDIVALGAWNQPLFARLPYVRKLYTIDSRATPYWFNRSQRELVRELKKRQHQFVWICETDPRSYRLLARAGIQRETSISQPDFPGPPGEHYCAEWLRLANESPAGFEYPTLPLAMPDTELVVSDDEVADCRQWLQTRGIDPAAPLVCVQAGNKRTTRRGRIDRGSNTKYWHQRNWASVIDAVAELLPEARFLLCGVPAEIEMCEAILANCQSPAKVQTVADDLPMRRLLALLSIAHSCISVDTGPAHAAATLDCPLVVLFGKADPTRFRPVSSDSPVQVIVGQPGAKDPAEADIGLIESDQVVDAWRALQSES